MITLKVIGSRRNTLAVHHLDTYAELHELVAVYEALGYEAKSLVVEDHREERAA